MTAEPKTKITITILEMEIRVWMPLKPGDCCLAKIGNSPVLFSGPTPLAVRKAADEWRKAEWAKHHEAADRRAAKKAGA